MGRLALLVMLIGCGSDDPADSGYGANQEVPAQINCNDMCRRLVDCTFQLCDEKTNSTNYDDLQAGLYFDCTDACTDASLTTIDDSEWSCMFVETCREVLEHDSCNVAAHYTCD
jgi:hypothetical protein